MKLNYKIVSAGIIVLLAVAAYLLFTQQPKPTTPNTVVPKRHIQIGAWTEGFYDAQTRTLHTQELIDFETKVGKKMSIAHYYLGWEYLDDPILKKQFDEIHSHDWTPMLNVNPYFFSKCPVTGQTLYQSIAEGKCDEFLLNAAENLKEIDKPFYLLFAWEMNNPVNQWSIEYTGSSTYDFVAAWQHIHTFFKQNGVTNIIWVFCPNVPEDTKMPYATIYPGDEYVDWIGLDGYNWGSTQSWSQWASFSGIFTSAYNSILEITTNKPIMIAEVNSTDKGGNKAQWYIDMFMKEIPNNFPKISAVVIFNEDRTKQEKVNWKVDITQESLQGFRQAIQTDLY